MDDITASPLTKSPTLNLPLEPSTVDYEAEDAKDDSEYQVLWSNTMDEGKYRSPSNYKNIEVLLLCWAEKSDDLIITEEVSKLKRTFEECFNYHAQIEHLDASAKQTLQVQVNSIVANFVNAFDGPDTLLIVYYAGHGKPGKFFGSLECFGRLSENDRQKRVDTLVWNKAELLLKDARADVLEIFDCCYAGNLSLTRGEHRLFEFLGATKELSTTPVPGKDSFTEALIWALKKLVEEKRRFTTVELLRTIKQKAPDFPKGQTPVLSDRLDDIQAGRIMLHPLQKLQKDGSRTEVSSEENTKLDHFRSRTVTLHFDFADQPTHAEVETLGRQLNNVFERSIFGVNRVRWGGMKLSAAARAVGTFQAGLKRCRRASMKQPTATLNMGATEEWLPQKKPELLTPSSSTQHSPPALDSPATGGMDFNPPNVGAIPFPSSMSSNEESDESQISARKFRNKKKKSDIDGREAP
ncbi:MAG: hypothetical protein Q9161_008047 [Pseudevernia consocians]